MFDIGHMLIWIVTLPLVAALATAALGPRVLKGYCHVPTVLALLGAFIGSSFLFYEVRTRQVEETTEIGFSVERNLWTWAVVPDFEDGRRRESPPTSDFAISIVLRADALTAVMLVMVTFISSLVAIYSIGYMHGEPGYWRFFTYISLFVFSMCMLVSVSNFLLLYVFWEAVGVCSYLLIGFWYEKKEAAAAGKKAFLVNRVGDFGFALAIFLIWITYGTLNYHDTPLAASQEAAAVADSATVDGIFGERALRNPNSFYQGGGVGLAICLLLMLGACGKSAQFPLHVWLPDAMEGPTPVSALIHAATMVTAGVYMVARCAPLFMVDCAPQVSPPLVVACIGGFTALLAALIALTQYDLKRVLAYSTISQLGYMFLALGCGTFAGVSAGMFHMLTHAFFKALLFLGAGSVMHAMGGVIDMRRFGGLRKKLWITCITFAVGCIALAGLPPLAGFWSKDAVLAAVEAQSHAEVQHAWVYTVLFWSAIVTAGLTAFYTFRAFFMTFFGKEVIPDEAGHHAHESPPSMWVPLAILSVFAVIAGIAFGPWYSGEPGGFIVHAPSLASDAVVKSHGHAAHGLTHGIIALIGTSAALLGVGLAAFLYLGDPKEISWLTDLARFEWLQRFTHVPWIERITTFPPVTALQRAADKVYLGLLVRVLGGLLLLIIALILSPLLLVYYLSPYKLSQKKFYFDEIYTALIVWPLEKLAWFTGAVDNYLVDGTVNFIGWLTRAVGSLLRSLQMGLVPFYALAMVLGLVVMLAVRMIWM